MIGDADHDLLCSIVADKSTRRAESAKRLIETERRLGIFIFREDRDIRRDEGAKAAQEIQSSGDVGVASCSGRIGNVREDRRRPDAGIGSKRDARIAY